MEKFSSLDEAFKQMKSSREGLTKREARRRLKAYGPNSLKPPKKGKGIALFFDQFKSPLILLLIGAATLSFFLGGRADASIIAAIVVLSGLLGFFQERGALNALEKLLQLVESKVTVKREGSEIELSIHELVPGDLVILRAGDLIPADCLLVETKHFFVDEAILTGESIPAEKAEAAPLFLGTTVASGLSTALVVATGRQTEYSALIEKVRKRAPETAFEQGVRQFGNLLLKITLLLVIVIFAFNIFFKKPIIDSFLFSLALAVGLTPQLLPAIIAVNLSHGARRMAKKHVVVKRLASLEDFGQMNILCTDKTGTITEGKIQLDKAVDWEGKESQKTALYGYLNAHFQSGYINPLDQAILKKTSFEVTSWQKEDEIPYDFTRKRLSIVLKQNQNQVLITKGAVLPVLAICDRVELSDGTIAPFSSKKEQIERYFNQESQKGFRLIAVAYREGSEEKTLIFLGFLSFFDPIKEGIAEVVGELQKKGVSLKIITGDHHAVALHAAAALNIPHTSLMTGEEVRNASDEALLKLVVEKNLFAEIEPSLKERIITSLRQGGNIVGYLGDGINDVSALHSANVGIAVESGANAAKEASDIVLLRKDLNVLRTGVEEGRKTFANTLKYIYMASSANFGNMFSMAGISLFLNFLPLLPKQVLLTNFLSDFPEMALATDHVDSEVIKRPVKWDLCFIRRFMLVFGLLSSLADYLTFGAILLWLKADPDLFRTAWFVESVASAALIVFAIRTKGPSWRSKPGRLLSLAVLVIVGTVVILPFLPIASLFGFTPLPFFIYPILAGIIIFYFLSVEIAKTFFFKKNKNSKKV